MNRKQRKKLSRRKKRKEQKAESAALEQRRSSTDSPEQRRASKVSFGTGPLSRLSALHGAGTRPKKVNMIGTCGSCQQRASPLYVWDAGEDHIAICRTCNDMVRDVEHPSEDAIHRAILGGGFETNRRRH